jgi:hypothetical protein
MNLLGRRAFLRCQTVAELLSASSASVTTTVIATTTFAGDAQETTLCPPRAVIASECSALPAIAGNFWASLPEAL